MNFYILLICGINSNYQVVSVVLQPRWESCGNSSVLIIVLQRVVEGEVIANISAEVFIGKLGCVKVFHTLTDVIIDIIHFSWYKLANGILVKAISLMGSNKVCHEFYSLFRNIEINSIVVRNASDCQNSQSVAGNGPCLELSRRRRQNISVEHCIFIAEELPGCRRVVICIRCCYIDNEF